MGAGFPWPQKSEKDQLVAQFEAIMDEFDVVLDRCAPETIAYTKCINENKVGDIAGIYKGSIKPGKLPEDVVSGTCGNEASDLAGCFARRESRYALVRKYCGNLNQAYEVCMMENNKNPYLCLPTVRSLLQCTRTAIDEKAPDLKTT
eukprot:CAMPEP_0184488036 /NCGR_PEP_ID=MMETSP0113_2-20130426/10488_1 /TAXON_ID=91329 /ORGANISM="Norrisiella sphaerica, Strain BC52" /LENGTH=146 /DNA_ID=CAMNT_0026870501 /DNA_START=1 /DNA_END=441 /DNA_ORIENTATION=-